MTAAARRRPTLPALPSLPNRSATRGSSLILTLLIVTVLSIIVAAFLQSMSIERGTARSFANLSRAEMAVSAGVDEASAVLMRLFTDHPDSAIVWETLGNTPCAVAYFKDGRNPGPVSNPTTDPSLALRPDSEVFYRPLVSGAVVENGSFGHRTKSSALPFLNAANSVDINSALAGAGKNLLGALPGQAPASARVPWVVLRDAQGKQIARYAYFIEDESFKTNINLAGASERGDSTPGTAPSEISLLAQAKALKNSGSSQYASIDAAAFASSIVLARSAMPGSGRFFEDGQLNRVFPSHNNLRDDLKFVTTLHSGSLNLSRHGSKRLNLNAAVGNSNDPAEVKRQVDRIVRAIHFHLPRFGQRFYRTGNQASPDLNSDTQVTPEHERIYLYKIAANIRDQIDSDRQPTVINNDGAFSVRLGSSAPNPVRAIGFPVAGITFGASDVVAYGKEALPYLQEYALRAKTISFTPARRSAGAPTFAQFSFTLDHYFEFWNLSTKDITLADLGPNPYLIIYSQPAYDTAGGTVIPEGRDVRIPLTDFVDGNGNPLHFPAGAATVLTTDSTPNPQLCPNPSAVFRPRPPNAYLDINGRHYREFTGTTARVADGSPSSVNGWFRVNISARSTSQTDYQTEMAIGNDFGLIEGFTALPIPANLSINNDNNNRANSLTYFLRGGSLRGNSANLNQVADPRTNSEQLSIQRYASGGHEDQTRYYDSGLSNTNVPANSNFGNPVNPFTNIANWPDPAPGPYSATPGGALAVNLDRPLQSIGELGHVFDPARGINASAGGVPLSRGGGRTLRIGQSDNRSLNPNGLWSGNRTHTSYERAAWRLADIFSVTSEMFLPGRININGVLRDNGLALRSAIEGFLFSSGAGADPLLAGSPLDVSAFVNAVLDRVAPVSGGSRTEPTPDTIFWERGALSELPIFHQTTTLAGANMANAKDRAREELVRRLIELTCTKGNVFRIYCVGQAVQELPGGAIRVVSTSTKTTTVRVTPVFEAEPSDSFDASSAPAVIQRFRRPDRWKLEVLQ